MILRLALAELRNRPARALFLLGGYALGVAVMVVLLAVGEAMLEQARDRELVGGGDVVVVPAGISAEMLKAGGVSSLFLGIDHARFLQRNLLESPRGRREHGIRSASPILDGKPVELYAGERRITVIATGEIPSRARAAGASPDLLSGRWMDSDADRQWMAPTQAELLREIDRFHIPPVRDSTWAEWHYFNVVLDERRWVYATLMVAGEVGVPGRWGGRILLTVREPDGTHRSLTRDLPGEQVRFDTASPDLRFGERAYVRLEGDAYRVAADAGGVRVDLRVHARAAPLLSAHGPRRRGAGLRLRDPRALRPRRRHRLPARVRGRARRAGVPRPQLGRVARRFVGVGIRVGPAAVAAVRRGARRRGRPRRGCSRTWWMGTACAASIAPAPSSSRRCRRFGGGRADPRPPPLRLRGPAPGAARGGGRGRRARDGHGPPHPPLVRADARRRHDPGARPHHRHARGFFETYVD